MATRDEAYCNTTTDLLAVEPKIETYDRKRELRGFVNIAGIVYKLYDAGHCGRVYRDGVDLGAAQATAVAVDVDGEWHYDSTSDTLTLASTAAPSTHDVQAASDTWANIKTEAVARASERLRSYVNKPILKRTGATWKGVSLRDWDDAVIEAAAIDACARLVAPYDPERAAELRRQVYNPNPAPGEPLGIADMIKAGHLTLWNETTSQFGSGVIRDVALDATTTGGIAELKGEADTYFDLIRVVIKAAGTFSEGSDSTVMFESYIGGAGGLKTVTATSETAINGSFQHIGHGIWARFALGVYKDGDEWEIEVRGGEPDSGSSLRSVGVSRL